MYVYVLYHNTQGTKWKLNKSAPGSQRRAAKFWLEKSWPGPRARDICAIRIRRQTVKASDC